MTQLAKTAHIKVVISSFCQQSFSMATINSSNRKVGQLNQMLKDYAAKNNIVISIIIRPWLILKKACLKTYLMMCAPKI